MAFASVYNENQKQLLASMELPYGIADTDGRLLWVNRAMEAILKNEKAARRSLPVLFKEITPESLADMEHGLEAHVSYGEARYKVSVKRVDLHLGNEETRTGGGKRADGFCLERTARRAGLESPDSFLPVYFYDETELFNYMKAITDQKMVAGLIYLDNYDESAGERGGSAPFAFGGADRP